MGECITSSTRSIDSGTRLRSVTGVPVSVRLLGLEVDEDVEERKVVNDFVEVVKFVGTLDFHMYLGLFSSPIDVLKVVFNGGYFCTKEVGSNRVHFYEIGHLASELNGVGGIVRGGLRIVWGVLFRSNSFKDI